MFTTRLARTLLSLVGLFAFALWLPIAAITYVPGWHANSCDWHPRCTNYGVERAQVRIEELRTFMQHRGELPATEWTDKERTHLAEVRGMLDKFAIAAFLGAAVFFHGNARERAQTARVAMLAIGACVIVLPFFASFWREVFHPLLFSNNLWRNYPEDTSYWVMPRIYFQYTTALVIGVATLVCAALRYQALGQVRAEGGRLA